MPSTTSTAKASWERSTICGAYLQATVPRLLTHPSIVVEFAKESRPRREVYEERAPRARRPPGHRLIVSGISRDTSWQVWFSSLSGIVWPHRDIGTANWNQEILHVTYQLIII